MLLLLLLYFPFVFDTTHVSAQWQLHPLLSFHILLCIDYNIFRTRILLTFALTNLFDVPPIEHCRFCRSSALVMPWTHGLQLSWSQLLPN
jgi:hypothetical protein